MTVELLVPTLGESVVEATIAKWMKSPGESINSDEPLVELETEKVTLEVPSPISGVLKEISAKEGESVEVGALLGIISESNNESPTKNTSLQKNSVNKAIKFVKMGNVKAASKVIKPAINYLIKKKCKKIILGCTELPIAIFAFKSFKKVKTSKIFLDPNLILANAAMKKYRK